MDAKRQIGLSGRTVRPKLIITCGVSGAVQFVAGMRSSELIGAINKDEKAPVMRAAHIAIAGDLYEVLPALISRLKGGENNHSGGNAHAL
jgi:electron transfer flavoprotein alpha subunit